jgi:ABC-2 type transport system permease protein
MMQRQRPYLAVLSARYRMLLQYRAAALAGFGTQLFWGAIRLMILAAFYDASTRTQPMSISDIVPYVWLGQALFAMLPWNVDAELVQKIRDGSVAYELLRPLDLYTFWYARTLALRTAPTTLRCIPMLTFSMLLLPAVGLEEWAMPLPPSLLAGSLFCLSIAMAFLVTTAITMLVHISLLWTLSAQGADRVMPAVVMMFSGMIVPLPLLPDWVQPLLVAQPFRGLVDVPFRIYSGNIAPDVASIEIVQQGAWLLLLIWLGRRWLARGTRQLVVQGG